MAYIDWTPDLDTGIHEIDVQHRRIVDYINRLNSARMGSDRAAIGAVIEETIDYTLSHFAFEEALMVDAGYLYSGPHKRVHELFTKRVTEFRTRFEAGEDIADELHGMLGRWLINHIRADDVGYLDAVKAHVRKTQSIEADMRARIKQEVISELSQSKSQAPRGWFARLFG
ncbi:hemerythrin [Comamonas serinivorans]|uniref:Hemerythrin n=1 Tax=Comamonas serinivorans TaxID=1082851 RepID=A0A1Y0EMK3_9BURK|nr:bacteriohemerythrin [Comamonas serinivorans]ARU04650.1 hemerythrin [Comamonas serinivorans]